MHHLPEEQLRQESVDEYPQSPKVEDSPRHVQVVFNRQLVADTHRAKRVLERDHSPVFYIPPEDVNHDYLIPSGRFTLCPWMGRAEHYAVLVNGKIADNGAWTYNRPTPEYDAIRRYVAFYPGLMDECLVDGKKVRFDPADSGGWITPEVRWPPAKECQEEHEQ